MQSTFKSMARATAGLLTPGSAVTAPSQKKKALLVIDVQENLLKPDSKIHMDPTAVPSFIRNLNKTIKFFEKNNLPVIYIVNEWTNPLLNALTGNVCKKGAKGTGIDERVYLANDTIYRKSRMSAFSNKELSEFLIENSISELYITGLFAEACVKGTAISATRDNYKVVIIEDATGSKNAKKKSRSVSYCQSNGATIITSDQLWQNINTGNLVTAG